MKTCGRCGVEQPLAAFNRDKARKDGHHTYCRGCNASRFRERRLRDGDLVRAQDRERHERHREARNAAARDYNRLHARENADQAREWRERNQEYCHAELRRYARENPDLVAALHARKRARRRTQMVEFVSPLVVLERDDGVCGICGGDVDPFDWHLDHIVPLSRGGEHSYANTQPSHPACNLRKHTQLQEEMAT